MAVRARTALLAITLMLGATGTAFLLWPLDPESSLPTGLEGDPARGAYIARMSGCIGCHTDTDEDGPVLAGGPSLETAFGVFFAPNITPDETYGIGTWTVADFERALRRGVSPIGDPYYPAFPYAFYTRLSDQDVADLWAALWTVPPVAKPSTAHRLDWPFDVRSGLKLWRALFFDTTSYLPDPDRSESWNRGRFIVTGPAHCGACHTPRNILGARDSERRFLGAKDLPGGHKSPGIRPTDLRAAGWTERDVAFALRTGIGPDGDSLGGSMGEIIRDSTSWLSDTDLTAIATYLMDDSTGPVE